MWSAAALGCDCRAASQAPGKQIHLIQKIVSDTPAFDDYAIESMPIPLPSPSGLCVRRLRFNVSSSVIRVNWLATMPASWGVPLGEFAATSARSQMRLHIYWNFSLYEFHTLRPAFVPARQQSCGPASIAICIRRIIETVVYEFQFKNQATMFTRSNHAADCKLAIQFPLSWRTYWAV